MSWFKEFLRRPAPLKEIYAAGTPLVWVSLNWSLVLICVDGAFFEPAKKVADVLCERKREVGGVAVDRSELDLVGETVASEGLELDDVPTGS